MQHAQLIDGIKRVTKALEFSALRDALTPDTSDDAAPLLEALRRYAIAASNYTSTEETVADLLGLSELNTSTVWAKLLDAGSPRSHYYERIGFVTHHLPRFVELLEESSDGLPSGNQTLCVTIVGSESGLLTSRLITIVNSVTTLYRTCASVNGIQIDDLVLVSVDINDDSQLWFEGEEQAVEWLKEVLTNAFRWLALYRERAQLQERIEAAKNNLQIIQRVHDARNQGSMSGDEANEIEHDLLVGLLAFFDAGALIPEMEHDLSQTPREIVRSSVPPASSRKDPEELNAIMSEIEELAEVEQPPRRRDDASSPGDEAPPIEAVITLEEDSVEISEEPV